MQADALKAQQHEENTRRAAEALERRRQAQLSADQHAEEQAEREAQRQVNIPLKARSNSTLESIYT